MIRSIIERTGVKIDVEDDGRVNVASADGDIGAEGDLDHPGADGDAGAQQDLPGQGSAHHRFRRVRRDHAGHRRPAARLGDREPSREGRARRAERRRTDPGQGDQHRPDRQDSAEPQGAAAGTRAPRSPSTQADRRSGADSSSTIRRHAPAVDVPRAVTVARRSACSRSLAGTRRSARITEPSVATGRPSPPRTLRVRPAAHRGRPGRPRQDRAADEDIAHSLTIDAYRISKRVSPGRRSRSSSAPTARAPSPSTATCRSKTAAARCAASWSSARDDRSGHLIIS